MKKLLIIGVLSSLLLSACGAAKLSDADMAAKYSISLQQYQQIKNAAEGMGMSVESHLQSLGYQPKQ